MWETHPRQHIPAGSGWTKLCAGSPPEPEVQSELCCINLIIAVPGGVCIYISESQPVDKLETCSCKSNASLRCRPHPLPRVNPLSGDIKTPKHPSLVQHIDVDIYSICVGCDGNSSLITPAAARTLGFQKERRNCLLEV